MDDKRPWKIPRPAGLREYILKNCQEPGYLIFNDKAHICFCTRCEKMTKLRDGTSYTHESGRKIRFVQDRLKLVACPSCGKLVLPKDKRYGRKGLMYRGRILWSRAYGRATIFELDDFIIDYTDVIPAVSLAPSEQIRMTKKRQERFDFAPWYYDYKWEPISTIRLRPPAISMQGYTDVVDYVYEKLPLGSDLRYAKSWHEAENEGYDPIGYYANFLKYNSIELLEKSGFEKIVKERSYNNGCRSINWRGTDLRSVLKLNMAEIRSFRENGADMYTLTAYNEMRKLYRNTTFENLRYVKGIITGGWNWNVDSQAALARKEKRLNRHGLTLQKVVDYLLAQEFGTLNDYLDYIGWVDELGVRSDKKTMLPKSFQQAHDELMEQVQEVREAVDAEKFKENELALTGMIEPYVSGALLIRPAASPKELRQESKVLGHCVRTYADRVLDGSTSILFIRKAEDSDTPYFTLELSASGRIVQCRGDHNCAYPDDVAAFINEWYEWWKKMMKKNRKTAGAA